MSRAMHLTAAAAALSLAAAAGAETVIVHVYTMDFTVGEVGETPVDAVINVGDTIQWVWEEGFHTVKSLAGSVEVFNEGLFGPGHTFEHTFTNAGVHSYVCTVHGADRGDGTFVGMGGTITVNEVEPECATDCNKDGRLNINDFICFKGKFDSRDPYADYDDSGTYTINDFIRFQSDFARTLAAGGC